MSVVARKQQNIENEQRSPKKRIHDCLHYLRYRWDMRISDRIWRKREKAIHLPEPQCTIRLQQLLHKVEKRLIKICWDEESEGMVYNIDKVKDEAESLLSEREMLLNALFTWSQDEINLLEKQNAYFASLLQKLYQMHTDTVAITAQQSDRLKQVYYASVESTINYYPYSSEQLRDLNYLPDLRHRYPSDFYRMHLIIAELDDIDAAHYLTSSKEGVFDKPEDCWNDGYSWAELLHDPRLEHITFSYLTHSLHVISNYSIPDLFFIRHFRFDSRVEYTDYNHLDNSYNS